MLFTLCCQNDSALGDLVVINSVEELDAIIVSCRNNEFETQEEIENNLIGEWKVIFEGTEYESLKFKIIDEIIPGMERNYKSVC